MEFTTSLNVATATKEFKGEIIYIQMVHGMAESEIQKYFESVKESIDGINVPLSESLCSTYESGLPDQTLLLKTRISSSGSPSDWYTSITIEIDFEMILPMLTEEQVSRLIKDVIYDACYIPQALDDFYIELAHPNHVILKRSKGATWKTSLLRSARTRFSSKSRTGWDGIGS